MNDGDLKSCPLCREAPYSVPQTSFYSGSDNPHRYRVLCPKCGTQSAEYNSPAEAISGWGRGAIYVPIRAVNDGGLMAALANALQPFADHAEFYDECDEHPDGCPDNLTAGGWTNPVTVGDYRRASQAIAAWNTRADAKAGERDAIVSWLRKEIAAVNADNSYWGGPHRAAYPDAVRIADAIERGDYRSSPPADAPPVKQSLTSEAIEAVRLMRAYYAAEDARNDCDECDNEGPWEHCGPCGDRIGEAINDQLLFLQSLDSDAPIIAALQSASAAEPVGLRELRERTAKVADGHVMSGNDQWSAGHDAAARKIAHAIRSLPLS